MSEDQRVRISEYQSNIRQMDYSTLISTLTSTLTCPTVGRALDLDLDLLKCPGDFCSQHPWSAGDEGGDAEEGTGISGTDHVFFFEQVGARK